MIGSMLDLCGEYERALKEYLKAKRIWYVNLKFEIDRIFFILVFRLPYNHPDSAFAFCSFGVTFYKMNDI